MQFLGTRLEYIKKHNPEDNGDIESFHSSIKTDYIWPNQFMYFKDASMEIRKAFNVYN
jgi:transposase InsO family protein